MSNLRSIAFQHNTTSIQVKRSLSEHGLRGQPMFRSPVIDLPPILAGLVSDLHSGRWPGGDLAGLLGGSPFYDLLYADDPRNVSTLYRETGCED